MRLLWNLLRAPEQKASRTAQLVAAEESVHLLDEGVDGDEWAGVRGHEPVHRGHQPEVEVGKVDQDGRVRLSLRRLASSSLQLQIIVKVVGPAFDPS